MRLFDEEPDDLRKPVPVPWMEAMGRMAASEDLWKDAKAVIGREVGEIIPVFSDNDGLPVMMVITAEGFGSQEAAMALRSLGDVIEEEKWETERC